MTRSHWIIVAFLGAAGGAGVLAVTLGGGDVPVAGNEDAAPQVLSEQVAATAEPEAEEAIVTAEADPAAEEALEEGILPEFDAVRMEPDGNGVIAGRAAAGAMVALLIAGETVAEAQADATGAFVAFVELPPSELPRVLTLEVDGGEEILASAETIIIAPTAAPEVAAVETAELSPEMAGEEDVAEEEAVSAEAVTEDTSTAEESVTVEAAALADDGQVAAVAEAEVADVATEEIAGAETEDDTVEDVAETAVEPVEAETVAVAESAVTEPVAEGDVAEQDIAAAALDTAEPDTIAAATEQVMTEVEVAEAEAANAEVYDIGTEDVVILEANDTAAEPLADTTDTQTLAAELVEDTVAEVASPSELASVETDDPETAPNETVEAGAELTTEEPVEEVVEEAAVAESTETPSASAEDVLAEDPVVELAEVEAETLIDPVTEIAPQVDVAALGTGFGTEATGGAALPQATQIEAVEAPVSQVVALEQPLEDATPLDAPQPEVLVEVSSLAVPEVTASPASLPVLMADADGVRVLQPALAPGADAEVLRTVALDAISYDASGEVVLTGRATGGGLVRVYLNNAPVIETSVSADGVWTSGLPGVETGVYTLRVDQIGANGAVISRMETPFRREERETIAAVLAEDFEDDTTEVAVRTVQPGNTLWGISQERYGEGILYVQVFEANRDLIRDPNLIYPGQILRIPEAEE